MSISPQKMPRVRWLATPYAGSKAARTEDSVGTLLEKYMVQEFSWAQGRGQNNRPAVCFRFILKGKAYRILIETLLAYASSDELMTQAKRVIYHYLKSALEMASVFMPLESTLFAFLELPNGETMFECAAPRLATMNADGVRLMLPGPKEMP